MTSVSLTTNIPTMGGVIAHNDADGKSNAAGFSAVVQDRPNSSPQRPLNFEQT